MKVVTYLRVSTEDQTVDPQRLDLMNYLLRQGWAQVGEYSDVISGAKAARPGLDALVARCAAGGIDAVVVVKIDRLGRSALNVFTLVKRLADMGTAIICTTQGIDTRNDNPCGKMMLAVMAAFAEMERDFIRERTKAGLRATKARGTVLGRHSEALKGVDVEAVVKAWIEACKPAGYRGLALRLGGCSPATAKLRAEAYGLTAPRASVCVEV